eukprot:scaffold129387_cov26-Tisochrysis_lutea.AAC.2
MKCGHSSLELPTRRATVSGSASSLCTSGSGAILGCSLYQRARKGACTVKPAAARGLHDARRREGRVEGGPHERRRKEHTVWVWVVQRQQRVPIGSHSGDDDVTMRSSWRRAP